MRCTLAAALRMSTAGTVATGMDVPITTGVIVMTVQWVHIHTPGRLLAGAPLGGGAGEALELVTVVALVSKVCNKSDSSRGIEFDRNSQTKGFHVVSRFLAQKKNRSSIFLP